MVGHRREVDGSVDLRANGLITIGVGKGNGFAFRVFVGAIGVILLIRQIRVEGIAGVDMEITKQGLSGGHRDATGLDIGLGR